MYAWLCKNDKSVDDYANLIIRDGHLIYGQLESGGLTYYGQTK